MGNALYIKENNSPVLVPCLAAPQMNIGDFTALVSGNATTGSVYTFASGFIASGQVAFANQFLGHCFQFKGSGEPQVYGNPTSGAIGVSTSGQYEADVNTATTFVVGDYVGLSVSSSYTTFAPQTVMKVASKALAIGVVTAAGTNLTRVQFRLLPTVVPFAR